ncbi:hypothetical protein BD289DRAFT_445559 [Coniella lustricola]|uniref:Secreted protein n=1 Tax=Coniella lustricola TaxID=2025994 RepID=A0A2T2ZUS5_9PEZI|nr:hypothetical protein BD289DRAFT_445559 [Coniella lustricola]
MLRSRFLLCLVGLASLLRYPHTYTGRRGSRASLTLTLRKARLRGPSPESATNSPRSWAAGDLPCRYISGCWSFGSP